MDDIFLDFLDFLDDFLDDFLEPLDSSVTLSTGAEEGLAVVGVVEEEGQAEGILSERG